MSEVKTLEDFDKGLLPNSKYKGKKSSFKVKDLDTGMEYKSIREYARQNNFCNKTISDCLKKNNCKQNIVIIY